MKKRIKLKSTIVYNKKIAKKLMKSDYYQAQAKNLKQWEHIENEKIRLSTPKWERIDELIQYYRNLGFTKLSSTGLVLQGIYNRNKTAVSNGESIKNTNLISVIAKPETILLAYREIKGNSGALTKAAEVSKEDYAKMDDEQKVLYARSLTFPDGISLYDIYAISRLIKTGRYPWGASRRIYVEKPGQPEKMRPLTIPPFMDKVVQKTIELVLQAIYEPLFENMNRSFGFRPNKGTHDALAAILSTKTSGMRTAVEGDVEAAYDCVVKEKLISILEKRICDSKFINLLRNRLNYEFVEADTKKRISPELGIPQGGIDSPYLFNIYMHELDEFVRNDIQEEINRMNSRITVKRKFSKLYTSNRAKRKKLFRQLDKFSSRLKLLPKTRSLTPVKDLRNDLFNTIKSIRLNEHQKNNISTASPNSKILRYFFVRYADDWILLTNGSKEIAKFIKEKIAQFLSEELSLRLSEKKTLITDITKKPARFLGFEIRASARGPLRKMGKKDSLPDSQKKFILCRKACVKLWAQPDKQRLISRYNMKGLCDKVGFPISVPWLSCVEAHAIVERFNAVMRGIAEFYLPMIRNRAKIHRWIYICRFACLKTLAQKYRCSIGKIFKRFGYNLHSRGSQTVRITVQIKLRNESYKKYWNLLTYQDLVELVKYKENHKESISSFWDVENGQVGEYPIKKGRIPKVTNDQYLEKISWISWRTSAQFDLPCANCGTSTDVQQHHLRAIRKRSYALIPGDKTYQQVMALRNRKQIPLCIKCHVPLTHQGKYQGVQLIKLAPRQKLVDNRITHIEAFIQPGQNYNALTLEEKGWTKLSKINKETKE